jgi:hypothetical protein
MKLQLLAGGALVALLAGCGQRPGLLQRAGLRLVAGGAYYIERYPTYSDTRVEAIEVLRGASPGSDMYRVTVRRPDGAIDTYVMQTLGTLRAGDRVRIVNGTIYPLG